MQHVTSSRPAWLPLVAAAFLSVWLTACGGGASVNQAPPATTVPSAPSGVAASAGNSQVVLSWLATSGATNYVVKRSASSSGPYTQIGSSPSSPYSDLTAVNSVGYYYVVDAVNAAGSSPDSAAVTATPMAPAQAPPTPASVIATAGNAQVTITWASSSGAASYHVKRSATASGPFVQLANPSGSPFVDSTATNGVTYYYVISALNSVGESADSSVVTATASASTQVPSAPSGLSAAANTGAIVLNWTVSPGATSYNVRRSTAAGGPFTLLGSVTVSGFSDTAVTGGTTYYYVVSAVNSVGESSNSVAASATATVSAAIPTAPVGLVAAAGVGNVKLQWTISSGATSYNVKRSTVSGGAYSTLGTATATNYTDSTVVGSTTYFYVVSAVNSIGESQNSGQVTATPTTAAVTVTVSATNTHPISPYIYGVNSYSGIAGAPPGIPFDRAGGNRWTAYNWETNASNAGSDYMYENDAYLTSSTTPAEAVRSFISSDQASGMASLVTFQMQGLVAADEAGPVSTTNAPDLTRFKKVVFSKSTQSSAPFTATPPTTDASVYMDEFIVALDQKFSGQNIFGPAPATQRVFAQLDNEPELWNTTHLEVQGSQVVAPDPYIASTTSLATALKTQFPSLLIFGPVHYGFYGIYAWQGLVSATPNGSDWFADKYLKAMKAASTTFGRPLVDVYDIHWYSEATDGSGTRVTTLNGATLSDAQVQAIVQSPRSLWDTTYSENSWISSSLGGPIYILGRLQSKIDVENPGMRLSITEYNNGGAQHIAGTIAQADNLGIFGAKNLFAANYWSLTNTQTYALAGFRAYRNFDGAGSNFGDVSVSASSSNIAAVSGYVSTDTSRAGRVVVVLINRSTATQVTAVTGQTVTGSAHIYQMTAASAAGQAPVKPVPAGTLAVSGSSFSIALPALSVTTLDIY